MHACRLNFTPGERLILAGTIQFAAAIQAAKQRLAHEFPSLQIPQSRPLSPGKVQDVNGFVCIYIYRV